MTTPESGQKPVQPSINLRRIIYPTETIRNYGSGVINFEEMISLLSTTDGKGVLLAAQFLIARSLESIGQKTALSDLDRAHDLLILSEQRTLTRNNKKINDVVARARIHDAGLPVYRSFVRGELPNAHATEEAYLKTVNTGYLFSQQVKYHPEKQGRIRERSDRFLGKVAISVLLQRQSLNAGFSTRMFPMITPSIPMYQLTGDRSDLEGIYDIDVLGQAPTEKNIRYLRGSSIKVLSRLCVNSSGYYDTAIPARVGSPRTISIRPDLQLQGSDPMTIPADIIDDAFGEKYGSSDAPEATKRLDARANLIGLALQRQKTA